MTYTIKLNKYTSIETHWIAVHVNGDDVKHFESFRVKYVPKEIKKFIGNKNVATDIYRIQSNDSIVSGYFCTGFIDFVLKCKSLSDYTNLFSAN